MQRPCAVKEYLKRPRRVAAGGVSLPLLHAAAPHDSHITSVLLVALPEDAVSHLAQI
jgi:hypothetical protein